MTAPVRVLHGMHGKGQRALAMSDGASHRPSACRPAASWLTLGCSAEAFGRRSARRPSSQLPVECDGPPRRAFRALRVLGQSSRETSAVKKAGRASAGGRGCCDVAGWIDQFRIGSRRRERPGGADHCTLVPERRRSRLAAGFRFDRLAFKESAALGGALAGGFVGTVVLTSGLRAGSELRLTRIDLPFLLGTALFSDRIRAKAAHTSRTSPSDSLLGQLRTRGA